MTIDQDILKTLRDIEKHLKSASSTVNSASRGKIAGGDSNSDKAIKVTVKGMESLNNATAKLEKSFVGLNKTVLMTRASFVALNKHIRQSYKVTGGGTKSDNTTSGGNGKFFTSNITKAATASGKFTRATTKTSGSVTKFKSTIESVNNAGIPLGEIFKELGKIIDTVVNDSFRLLARGVGAKSLTGLYVDAAKAGMSLQEYSDMMAQNMPVVARFKSFDEFNTYLTTVTDELANFGVFGKDAAIAATAAMSANAKLGVAHDDLSKAAISQTKVFKDLRKSTLITAEEFAALGVEISRSQDVQSHMLGLSQRQRAARMEELIQMRAFGKTLGATAESSKAFSDALMAHRGSTIEQRFKTAGYIRQAGSILGMSASDSEELAGIMRKRNITKEDQQRILELGGRDLIPKLEALADNGDVSAQNISDQLRAALQGTGAMDILQKAGNVALEAESGKVQNVDLAKAANSLEKAAGDLMTAATGLSKNPIAMAATSILGLIAGGMVGGKLFNIFKSMIGAKMSGGKTPTIQGPKNVGTAAKSGGKISSVVSTVGNAASGIMKGISTVVPNTLKSGTTALLEKSKAILSPIGKMFSKSMPAALGTALKAIPGIGVLAGYLIDSVGEMFTGTVSAAFDPKGENGFLARMGNVVYAGLSGIIGSWADLADSIIGMFTDDGLNLRNAWDKFAVGMRSSFMHSLLKIIESIPFLGKKSGWAKSVRESAEAADAVLEQLNTDSTLTLADVGRKNKQAKELNEQTTKATEATTATINKTIQSTTGLSIDAINSARTLARPAVTPQPTVNSAGMTTEIKPEQQNKNNAANKTVSVTTESTKTTERSVDVVAAENTQMREIVEILKATLETNQQQNSILENLIRAIRNGGSSDTTLLLNRLSTQI